MTWSREMSHMSKIFNFVFLTPFSDHLKMLHFDANPIKIGYLDYRVTSNLWVLKTISKKRIWPLSMPISQKRYLRHQTHSPWSCHICLHFSKNFHRGWGTNPNKNDKFPSLIWSTRNILVLYRYSFFPWNAKTMGLNTVHLCLMEK